MANALWDQSSYQVRFEWGIAGLARLAGADVVVVVDALGWSAALIERLENPNDRLPDHPAITSSVAARVATAAAASRVFAGSFSNAPAVARAVLTEQSRRRARTSVAVIASDQPAVGDGSAADGPLFAVENLLAAGAIIDALAAAGIDHSSPEAAAAGEAFRSLRGALRHLVAASGTGRFAAANGIQVSVQLDSSDVVPEPGKDLLAGQ